MAAKKKLVLFPFMGNWSLANRIAFIGIPLAIILAIFTAIPDYYTALVSLRNREVEDLGKAIDTKSDSTNPKEVMVYINKPETGIAYIDNSRIKTNHSDSTLVTVIEILVQNSSVSIKKEVAYIKATLKKSLMSIAHILFTDNPIDADLKIVVEVNYEEQKNRWGVQPRCYMNISLVYQKTGLECLTTQLQTTDMKFPLSQAGNAKREILKQTIEKLSIDEKFTDCISSLK